MLRTPVCAIAAFSLAVLFLGESPLEARDFPDPYATIDPLHLLAEDGAGAVMDWEFNYQFFRDSDLDNFQLNLLGGAGILDVNRKFGLGLRYGKFLLTGPGGEDKGTPHMAWLMNSVQFEYGLHAAFALSPQIRLLAEYSRASNHPFGDQKYIAPDGKKHDISNVSYDRVAFGVGARRFSFGTDGTLTASLRLAYTDLWDAWDPQGVDISRVAWLLRGGIHAEHGLPVSIFNREETKFFTELYPDLFTQHVEHGGGIDANFVGRVGLRLEDTDTGRVIDTYLDTYFSRDSEMVRGRAFPVGLVGLGFRIGNASRP